MVILSFPMQLHTIFYIMRFLDKALFLLVWETFALPMVTPRKWKNRTLQLIKLGKLFYLFILVFTVHPNFKWILSKSFQSINQYYCNYSTYSAKVRSALTYVSNWRTGKKVFHVFFCCNNDKQIVAMTKLTWFNKKGHILKWSDCIMSLFDVRGKKEWPTFDL